MSSYDITIAKDGTIKTSGDWELGDFQGKKPEQIIIQTSQRKALLKAINGDLGFATPADAASAVQVVKRHLLSALRDEVARTVESGEDAEQEFRRVVAALT